MFNPFMARLVNAVVTQSVGPMDSVVEFGNQRYGAAGALRGFEGVTTTKQFYKKLGFREYLALDVNTEMDAVVVDLNEPITLPHGAHGSWDLVTNNGTGEHIFDQAMVFKNAHDLCAVGGIMLHVLPFSPWINHGFYTFQPILFRDLAAANGYEIDLIAIGHRDDDVRELDRSAEPWLFAEKKPDALLAYMANVRGERGNFADLLIGVSLRKRTEEPFRKPLQGKYQADVRDDNLRNTYKPKGR